MKCKFCGRKTKGTNFCSEQHRDWYLENQEMKRREEMEAAILREMVKREYIRTHTASDVVRGR